MSTILVNIKNGSCWKLCSARFLRKALTTGVSGKTLIGEGVPKAAAEIRTMAGTSSNVQTSRLRGMVVKEGLVEFTLTGAAPGTRRRV